VTLSWLPASSYAAWHYWRGCEVYQGWLEVGGVEVVNSARATAYAQALGVYGVGCPSCQCLHYALGDEPYTNPASDLAPWYDPAVPASARFGGYLGMSVDGIDAATSTRTVAETVGDGGVHGRLRRPPREVVVTALAVACDEQALTYGLSWLASALRGGACAATCAGDPMCLFTHCPGEASDMADWDEAQRHLFDVALTGGPAVTERLLLEPGSCRPSVAATVEYTLTAATPWLYRRPTVAVAPPFAQVTGTIVDPPAACTTGTACTPDPNCPAPPARPVIPPPTDACACTLATNPWRTTVEVSPQGAGWLEAVPVIEVRAGATPITCLKIRFWASPGALTCTDAVADPCNFCGELGVGYVPAGATLFVDGRTRTAYLACGAGTDPRGVSLTGAGTQRYTWPVLDCPGQVCVELLASGAAADAQVSVSMVVREDMA
jgi:hypothetical protein